MAAKKTNRCWPGYEPVPGKKPNSQGSCRPKADSKSTPGEKQFKAKRRKQLDEWQTEHKGDRREAAQHLHGPDGEPSSQKGTAQKRKAAASKKRAPARKSPAGRSSSSAKKGASKKVTAKKSAAGTRRKAA